jgi:hypothetical protein
MNCKYQINKKDYIICSKDNSIRRKGCPCAKFEYTFWQKVKLWFKENW